MNQDQKRNKYYCKRCKRYLPYKICPIHGLDYMEVIKGEKKAPASDSLYTNPQQSTAHKGKKINDKWALPAPGENQSLSNLKTPNPDAKIARLDDDLSTPSSQDDLSLPSPQNGNGRPAPPQNGSTRPAPQPPAGNPADTFDIKEIFKDVQFDEPAKQAERPPQPTAPPQPPSSSHSRLEQKIEEKLSSLRSARNNGAANNGTNSEFADSLTSIDIDAIVTEKPQPSIHSSVHPQARRPEPVVEHPPTNPAIRANTPPPQPQRRKTRRKPVGKARTKTSLPKIPTWAYIAGALLLLIIAGTVFTYQQAGTTNGEPAVEEPGVLSNLWESVSGATQALTGIFSSNENVPAVPTENVAPIELSPIEEAGEQYTQLMNQANLAYQEGSFLSPADINVIAIIDRILEMEPEHKGALDLRDQVLLHYFEAAETALDNENYGASVEAYKNILKIKPNDPEIISEINRTLELKKVHDALNEMDKLADTQAEIKDLQKQKYRLRSEIQNLNNSSTASRRGRTGSRPTTPVQVDGLDKLGISNKEGKVNALELDQKDIDALGIEVPEDNSPPLVSESMIDAGAKEYVRKDLPFVPRRLRSDDKLSIEAECVVNKDGEVESVNILTPTRNPQLNQLALNAFRNFRFKPASYKGNPVRFKVVEILEVESR